MSRFFWILAAAISAILSVRGIWFVLAGEITPIALVYILPIGAVAVRSIVKDAA